MHRETTYFLHGEGPSHVLIYGFLYSRATDDLLSYDTQLWTVSSTYQVTPYELFPELGGQQYTSSGGR